MIVEELLQIIRTMEGREIEYAVCGGLSMAVHGFARATMDIDLLIRPESLESAYEVSRTGLIKMKTLAGRPQDLADIDRLNNGES